MEERISVLFHTEDRFQWLEMGTESSYGKTKESSEWFRKKKKYLSHQEHLGKVQVNLQKFGLNIFFFHSLEGVEK